MKIYHFLPAEFALQNLKFRRVKISRLDELNDPFELVAVNNSKIEHRIIWDNWRQTQAEKWGVVCFSKTWKNPVLWSHYADRHRGICLGFEVPDHLPIQVEYRKNRLNIDIERLYDEGRLSEEHMKKMFKTKFIDWKYEREARVIAHLEEKDEKLGLYFHSFDDEMKLTEVFSGPLCEETEESIRSCIQSEDYSVNVIKTRLAFKTFDVVQQQKGF